MTTLLARSQIQTRKKILIPFLTTSFAFDMQWYLILWPLWWLLGVDQLLPPVFLAWMMLRELWRKKGRLAINTPIILSAMLATWWIIPIIWIDRDHLDIFLKETATIWSQVLMLVLFTNAVRNRKEWFRIQKGLNILAFFIAIAGLVFITGVWRGQITSGLGQILPKSLVNSSEFFNTISFRSFGAETLDDVVSTKRIASFATGYGALSMVALMLIPFCWWKLSFMRGIEKLWGVGIVLGLLMVLFFTGARTAYLAFFAGLFLFIVLRLKLFQTQNRLLFVALVFLGSAILVGIGYFGLTTLIDFWDKAFVATRSGSFNVRIAIYSETLRLLPEHLLVGWGQPIRIPYLRTVFSAGTHSSLLGMLLQHGIIGLVLYLGIYVSLWRRIVHGIGQTYGLLQIFWIMIAVAMFSFHIREITATWWWDQLVTMIFWTLWGLLLAASKMPEAIPALSFGDNRK